MVGATYERISERILSDRAQHMAVGGRIELHPRSYPEFTVDCRLRHLDATPTVQPIVRTAWDGILGARNNDSRGRIVR